MTLLLLEALGALILFVFMVWWTMFSGRKNGELKGEPTDDLKAGHPLPPAKQSPPEDKL